MNKKNWRLGLDLGASSLGWAAVELDAKGNPQGILAAGARIFGNGASGAGRDPKSGASLAVDRRDARAMRRRRDRFKRRQAALLKYLEQDGFFPADPIARKALAALDPYELRARALDQALTLEEIGRAIFHLNQRRGFQSNRKADRGRDEEAGKIAVGVERLREAIDASGARTFGEFLHRRRLSAIDPNAIPSVRTRLRPETGEGAKGDGYDFYPGRDIIRHEFDEIWEAQALHHPAAMTPVVYARLHEIVFHQRPLKTPAIGMCTLVAGERRLPKAHPLFQRRRLLEELNALMILRPGYAAQRLTREQRDLLLLKLKDKRKATFASLRKVLKLDTAARFNKESDNRPDLKGDEVAAELASKTRFGTGWWQLAPEQQWEVVRRHMGMESDADEAAFRAWLVEAHALSPDEAKAVAAARLPQGYGRFGPTATAALIAALTDGLDENGHVLTYDKAVALAGYHHSDFRTGEVWQWEGEGRPAPWAFPLPYYGRALERHIMPGSADPEEPDEALRIGRLTNPTVHIGLNQLRRAVNLLIRRFGPPAEIALELARELKLSEDEKKQRNQENRRNREDAQKRSAKLADLRQRDSGANRALLKLWEELDGDPVGRRCVYSGQVISTAMLFDGRAEVDHILPFTATLDDSNANKIVCLREANRIKRRRSPFEARLDLEGRFGPDASWEAIAERAARLPRNKRWRFEPDAMERFAGEEQFLSRHLVDTQYLGRLAHEYLSTLYPDRGEGSSKVWVSPGRLTEMVRRKLGLNSLLPDHNFGGGADQPKNRLDHRHHAIDAAVVGILDRGMLNAIARASGEGATDEEMRILVPEPWPGFRDDLGRAVNTITVAHRPDHGTVSKAGLKPGRDQTAGRLHNDTAYGITGTKDARGNDIVVHRVPLTAFKSEADLIRIRDLPLRQALTRFTEGYEGKDFEKRLTEFAATGPADFRGIRRVRIVEPLSVIPIRDRSGRIYKGYKGDSNYRYDVWELPDGKWQAEVVSMFEAHQSGGRTRPHPAARKVLSLHRDDILAIERDGGGRELVRVVKFSEKQFAVAPPQEGGALKGRDANKEDPFRYLYPSPGTLKSWRARQVRVDEIGRVLDPGFPARKPRASPASGGAR